MQLILVLLLSFLVLQNAVADEAITVEQQALLKIYRHLTDLEPLIEAAEQSANPDSRIQFRYDWLRRDIAQVRKGVQAHVHKPLADKQANAPLHDDYRR
jgi:RAQPRD family integrative conjugative element protein